MPVYFGYKSQHLWKRHTSSVLRDKTIGILGLGHIGSEVARLAKAFGMRVIATRRSYKEGMKARNVDQLMPSNKLNDLLKTSDYVVITLPFTAETKNLIGEKELRQMKESACLINIGRGGIIDQTALTKALKENWIGGAALDVYTPEPLPADSLLWDLPNLIYSPHVSGSMVDYVSRATEVFCNNLERYLAGKRLVNVVNKRAGY
jgi:phosphoglycerate dehydrogenase-like enzyme